MAAYVQGDINKDSFIATYSGNQMRRTEQSRRRHVPFSVLEQTDSASSIRFLWALLASAYCSASATIFSMSFSLRPDEDAMVMD